MESIDFLLGKRIIRIFFCDVDGLSLQNNGWIKLIVEGGSKVEIYPTAEIPVGGKFEQLGLNLRIVDEFMENHKWPGGPPYAWGEIDTLEPFLNLEITHCESYDSAGDGLVSALRFTFENETSFAVEHTWPLETISVKADVQIPRFRGGINRHVIVFDGVCNFCNGIVNFIIRRDPNGAFALTPMQSEIGKELIAQHRAEVDDEDTILLIKNGQCYGRTDAVFEITRDLTGLWHVLRIFRILPRSFRDYFYRLFAKHRYKLFGRREDCMIPTSDIRDRFIE